MTRTRPGTVCIADDCASEQSARDRCPTHYYQWWIADQHGAREAKTYRKRKTTEQRFWDLVDRRGPDECWPWKRYVKDTGHAGFWVSRERRQVSAHTYALELATGERCPDGKEGCHRCDNPPCCNPAHIYFGTRRQNVDDRQRAGRTRRGSRHADAKLTEADVLAIRIRHAAGEKQAGLATEFGVTQPRISAIVNGTGWQHVGGPVGTRKRAATCKVRNTAHRRPATVSTEDLRVLIENRRRRGLTQIQVAVLVGRSQSTLSEWESGKSRPDVESLARWRHALALDATSRSHAVALAYEYGVLKPGHATDGAT